MALVDNCILHNKLGNAGEVGASEIGPNGTWNGTPDYAACKFGNGIQCLAGGRRVDFDGTFFTPNEWIIEYWTKAAWGITDGLPLENQRSFYEWIYDANNRVILYTVATGGFDFWVKGAGAGGSAVMKDATQQMAANTVHHWLFVFNRTGIAGTANTRRIYYDGASIATSNAAVGQFVVSGGTFSTAWAHATVYFSGIQDNIKIYNDTSAATIAAIIANKDAEGFAAAAGGRLIDGKIIAPLIDGNLMIN